MRLTKKDLKAIIKRTIEESVNDNEEMEFGDGFLYMYLLDLIFDEVEDIIRDVLGDMPDEVKMMILDEDTDIHKAILNKFFDGDEFKFNKHKDNLMESVDVILHNSFKSILKDVVCR